MTTRKLIQREVKNLTMEEVKDTIAILQSMIGESEKYKNSYFWFPHSTSHERSYAGFEHCYKAIIGEVEIIFESSYYESCRNCYYQKSIFINDESTTLAKVKTIQDELGNIFNEAIKNIK